MLGRYGMRGWHAWSPNEIFFGCHIVSGTSELLGMRPRCDPTIRTAPTCVYGRVASAWVFPAMGTENLKTMGVRGGHGVRDTSWGEKCIKGKVEVNRSVGGHGTQNSLHCALTVCVQEK